MTMPDDRYALLGGKALDAEAREQRSAQLLADERRTPVLGDHIAWGFRLYGATDGLSAIHRVGLPKHGDPYTTCGEPIPSFVDWLTLSPKLIRSIGECRYCKAEYARQAQGKVA